MIDKLAVGIGETKIVSGSKALHHLLPDLVPPIDRAYTVKFFFGYPNAIQGTANKQRKFFEVIYPYFVRICRDKKETIDRYIGQGMNTSITKVVDNAIVGYVAGKKTPGAPP